MGGFPGSTMLPVVLNVGEEAWLYVEAGLLPALDDNRA
jgi:hypothetical protein